MSTITKSLLALAKLTSGALPPAPIKPPTETPTPEARTQTPLPALPATPAPRVETPPPPAPSIALGGGRIDLPFICSKTAKPLVLRYRKNRYSGKCSYDSTITTFPEGSGPPPIIESYDLRDFDFNGIFCSHCKVAFGSGGPVRCGGGHFACRAGVSRDGEHFRCGYCRTDRRLGHDLKFIDGSQSASPTRRTPSTSAPLLASTPPPRLLKGPQR